MAAVALLDAADLMRNAAKRDVKDFWYRPAAFALAPLSALVLVLLSLSVVTIVVRGHASEN